MGGSMPADFIVDITKRYGDVLYEWGNRYIIHAADLTDAASAAPLIAAAEMAWHGEGVYCTQARVATVTANDGIYTTIPLDNVGEIAQSGNPLPAITTVNVEVLVSGLGRPGRKYYHPFLDATYMSTVAPFQWIGTYLGDFHTEIIDMINTLNDNGTPIVKDADHEWLNVAVVQKSFGFHQFTKASKRQFPGP